MVVMITVKLWITLFLLGVIVAVVTDFIMGEENDVWSRMHSVAIDSTFVLIGFALAALLAKVLAIVWAVT